MEKGYNFGLIPQSIMAILEVFENRPFDFFPELEVAACHVEANGKLLLLERGPNESEGQTWGVPAGKIEGNETPHQGAVRELLEETGIAVRLNDLEEFGKLYIRKHVTYVCHLFRVSIDTLPPIFLLARLCTSSEGKLVPRLPSELARSDLFDFKSSILRLPLGALSTL